MDRVHWIAALLALTLSASWAAPWLRAQSSSGIPEDVFEMGDSLREMFESSLSVRGVVAEYNAEPWITRIIRNSPRAARSWQLSPELVPSLEDGEIVDFVLSRAQHVAVCTIALWNRVSMVELRAMDGPSEALLRFMRDATILPEIERGRYNFGPAGGCVELTDREGETVVIRTRDEVDDVRSYERAFTRSEGARSNFQEYIRSQMYEDNAAYVEAQLAGQIAVDRGFANTLREVVPEWSDGRAFRFTMNNLVLYIATDLPEGTQLVFLAPSW